jgi:hypothetical protein
VRTTHHVALAINAKLRRAVANGHRVQARRAVVVQLVDNEGIMRRLLDPKVIAQHPDPILALGQYRQ